MADSEITTVNSASIPCYRWDPIPDALSDDGFRVLELLPSTPGGSPELRCKIHTVLLDDQFYLPDSPALLYPHFERAPRFAALSYCWGEDVREHQISCNGAVISITERLAIALSALLRYRSDDLDDVDGISRPSERRRFLWVDAICIDQENLAERRQQVRLMRRIFSKAEKTIVWLGDIDDAQRGVLAERLMREVAAVARRHIDRSWYVIRDWKDLYKQWPALFKEAIGADYEASVDALRRLFDNPWFTRAWIVQELVLSRNAEIHYGNHILKWKDIVDATQVWWSHSGLIDTLFPRSQRMKLPILLDSIKDLYSKDYSLQLFDLLQCLPCRIASDPRDLIYSLLGIANSQDLDRHGISPEYESEATVSSLFLKVACSILHTKRKLQILECANMFSAQTLSSHPVCTKSIPSWVPDWEVRPDEVPFLQHDSLVQFNAGGELATWFKVSEGNLLVLRGILEDVVECSGTWPEHIEYKDEDVFDVCLDMLHFENFVTKSSRNKYFNDEPLLDVYLLTMMSAHVPNLDDFRHRYKSLKEVLRKGQPFFSSALRKSTILNRIKAVPWGVVLFLRLMQSEGNFLDDSFDRCIRGRRLAWSSRNTLSMVPQATVPGDKLFIAGGARLPFIIRLLENGEYHLIGPTYTHGYMNGEAWTRQPKLKIEEIVLA